MQKQENRDKEKLAAIREQMPAITACYYLNAGTNGPLPKVTVDVMKQELTARGVAGLRLNYVLYQKVTSDEAVVDKSEGGVIEIPSYGAPDQPFLEELGKLFSLRQLADKPEMVAGKILATIGDPNAEMRLLAVEQVKELSEIANARPSP